MEEILLFVLSIVFGAFFFILVLICCLRGLAFLRDEDRKHLCFKRKEADIRRRRIQLSLLPEGVLHRPENQSYVAAPDENIDQYTICQPYVYEDGRSTGMRMIANLPISIAFTNQSGIPTDSLFTGFYNPPGGHQPPPLHNNPEVTGGHQILNCIPNFANLSDFQNYQNLHFQNYCQNNSVPQLNYPNFQVQIEDPPPPDYLQAQIQSSNVEKNGEELIDERDEPPPPTYDECMQNPADNSLLYF